MKTIKNTTLVLLIALLTNFAVWAFINRGEEQQSWGGRINSLSYSAWQAGLTDDKPDDQSINKDMEAIARHADAIRIYGVSDGLERVIKSAAQNNLSVFAGAWISKDDKANETELNKLIQISKGSKAVRRALIGNEALLREDITVETLIKYIEKAKRHLSIPISTAEPWNIWIKHPELVKSVDFITVHILPYWEGVDIEGALPYVDYRLKELKKAYPNKHIFLGEVGWPSDGQWIKGAEPSLINQARFTKDFLNYAAQNNIDYSIIEALDTPWKRNIEGSVGSHWGLLDLKRQPKFEMSGVVYEKTYWIWWCILSCVLAIFPIQYFVRKRKNLKIAGLVFYALLIQTALSLLVWSTQTALAEQIINTNTLAWIVLIGFQLILLALLLVDGFELTEVIWSNRQRTFLPQNTLQDHAAPKVSIHVPCYNEPPQMVMETLNALAKLDYPNLEVLVIDNNTKDEAIWRPLENHCKILGDRFRFFHLANWPGFKAGALNYALKETAHDTEIIGVIDSDYIVSSDWLRATIPHFDKENVAIVQAPQDYRDGQESLFKRFCFWEYAGFFHIGMVQRNERNAIIQHGTMTLMRKGILEEVDGWAEWCICEDAELGLRLFEKGYEAVYLNHSFGRGLIPDNFASYKTQRFRWAYGAVQILKKHWGQLSENKAIDGSYLTTGQRYHFITGWLPWFADAAHIAFVSAAVFWSTLLMFELVEFPPTVFLVPALSVFLFKIVAGQWLYRARVNCGLKDRIGAAVAGLALTHAVGRAVWQGIFTTGQPFVRTPKGDGKPAVIKAILMAREELFLLILLIASAAAILYKFEPANQDATIWASVLLVQTLPYWAAVMIASLNAVAEKQLEKQTVKTTP